MFGDTDELLLRRQATAAAAYQTWEEAMEVAVSEDASSRALAVIEIGCGERVPSVRRECEDVVRDTIARGGRAVLIRINPEAHDAELPAATNGAEEVDGEEHDEVHRDVGAPRRDDLRRGVGVGVGI